MRIYPPPACGVEQGEAFMKQHMLLAKPEYNQ